MAAAPQAPFIRGERRWFRKQMQASDPAPPPPCHLALKSKSRNSLKRVSRDKEYVAGEGGGAGEASRSLHPKPSKSDESSLLSLGCFPAKTFIAEPTQLEKPGRTPSLPPPPAGVRVARLPLPDPHLGSATFPPSVHPSASAASICLPLLNLGESAT